MKILFVSNELPYPPYTGAKLRTFNLLKELSRFHDVSVLAFLYSVDEQQHADALSRLGVHVHTVRLGRQPKFQYIRPLVRTFLKGQSLDSAWLFRQEMKATLERLARAELYEIQQFEHSVMAVYADYIADVLPPSRTFVDFHNVGTIQCRRLLALRSLPTYNLLNWLLLGNWEKHLVRRPINCLTTSECDRGILLSYQPRASISVVPNGVDTLMYTQLPISGEEKQILFVGNLPYAPNKDAVLYFYSNIFPFIRKAVPDILFTVVGSNPPPEVLALKVDRNVRVTGYVQDLVPYYRNAAITVAPLRAGSGTRLKIMESMALGRPVVSTTLGCEGLQIEDGRNILIADDPSEFSRAALELLRNMALRRTIANNARELVEALYSWRHIALSLNHLYENCIHDANPIQGKNKTGRRISTAAFWKISS